LHGNVAGRGPAHRRLRHEHRLSARRSVLRRLDLPGAQAARDRAVAARGGRARPSDGGGQPSGQGRGRGLRRREDELRAARQPDRPHPLAPDSAPGRRSRPALTGVDGRARTAPTAAGGARRPRRADPRAPGGLTPVTVSVRRGASDRREWLAVAGAFLVLAVVASVWLAIDRRPPEWDHANHLERAVQCARDIQAGDVRSILERSSFYPPLVLCLGGVGMLLGLSDAAAGGAVMIAFLGLGMAAVYLLGRRLAGGSVGVVAALLFGSAPFMVFSTLRFQLDLPLAAMVAVALVVLLATDRFTRTPVALAFGVVCGLGMLTKPTFALYVVVPVVMVLVRGGRAGLVNAALATLAAAVISLPWFGPRLFGLQAQLGARAFGQAAEAGHPEALSVAGVSFYPRMLMQEFGIGASVLFAGGLFVAAWQRRWLLLGSVLAPFVVLAVLIQNKNLRYALPLLAGMAVIAALALMAMAGMAVIAALALMALPRAVRRGAAVALLVLGV